MIHLSTTSLSCLALCVAWAHAAMADSPVVLGHDPGARPAESLIGELLERFDEPASPGGPERIAPGQPENSLIAGGGLPRTSELVPSADSAGIVRLDLPLSFPLCVIGPDPVSRRWLVRNRENLFRMGAVCILVQSSGRHEVENLRTLARPVPVHSVPFDQLATAHGIRTVPVLLAGKGAVLP